MDKGWRREKFNARVSWLLSFNVKTFGSRVSSQEAAFEWHIHRSVGGSSLSRKFPPRWYNHVPPSRKWNNVHNVIADMVKTGFIGHNDREYPSFVFMLSEQLVDPDDETVDAVTRRFQKESQVILMEDLFEMSTRKPFLLKHISCPYSTN